MVYTVAAVAVEEAGAAVCGCGDSDDCVGRQQRKRRGQATVGVAEAARGQTTIKQKAAAITAVTVVAADTASAVAVSAAMVTAAMSVAM